MSGVEALTEKEKETLRLLLVGHDAKSMARHFDVSVHTINERLRDARRKLSVSSSKEAARLLHDAEGATPEMLGDTALRDAGAPRAADDRVHAQPASRSSRAAGWAIGGIAMLSIIAALLAVSAPNQVPAESTPAEPTTAASPAPAESAVSKAARDWLALVDASDWQRSWEGTAASFRAANTVANWQAASQQARVPLGRVVSRTLIRDVDTPAPPNGYRTVQFRTDFANKRGATETVSLNREDGGWKVVGIYIE